MKQKSLCNIVFALLLSVAVYAQNDSIAVLLDSTVVVQDSAVVIADSIVAIADSAVMADVDSARVKPRRSMAQDTIYQGTIVKLDIGAPAVMAGFSKGKLQQYEIAVNVRLLDRYYPTLELGYAGGETSNDSISYSGHGGFFRVGLDINPLRKNIKSPHALLVGVRLGTSVQGYRQGLTSEATHPFVRKADCWGEIVAGCQVEIAKVKNTAFYMGWQGRIKCLFTRQAEGLPAEEQWALHIPGFGHRNNIGWGLSYHLAWKF